MDLSYYCEDIGSDSLPDNMEFVDIHEDSTTEYIQEVSINKLKSEERVWRKAVHEPGIAVPVIYSKSKLFGIFTIHGNFHFFHVDGRDWFINAGGRIRPSPSCAHPNLPYLLTRMDNGGIALIVLHDSCSSDLTSSTGDFIPLELPLPLQADQETNPYLEVCFKEINMPALPDDQLVIGVVRRMTLWFAVITTRGQVLHHTCMAHKSRGNFVEYRHTWVDDYSMQSDFLTVVEGALEWYTVIWKNDSLNIQLVKAKPLPVDLRDKPEEEVEILSYGTQFLMARVQDDLRIYRLDDSQLVFVDRDCLDPYNVECLRISYHLIFLPALISAWANDWSSDEAFRTLHSDEEDDTDDDDTDEDEDEMVRLKLFDRRWMNGLCPMVTDPTMPLMALIFRSKDARIYRWKKLTLPGV